MQCTGVTLQHTATNLNFCIFYLAYLPRKNNSYTKNTLVQSAYSVCDEQMRSHITEDLIFTLRFSFLLSLTTQ